MAKSGATFLVLLVVGVGLTATFGFPVANGQCPHICQAICAELHITCRDMGSSNGLHFASSVEQNASAIESQTGSGTTTASGAISEAGILRILSTWQPNATQEATTVDVELHTPTGVTYTSPATAFYNQTATEDVHEETFTFEVNPGFSGTASIPYTILTNPGTASQGVLNGTITFQVAGGSGAGTTSPAAKTPPMGLLLIVAAIVASLVLLRRRLGAAGNAPSGRPWLPAPAAVRARPAWPGGAPVPAPSLF